MRGGERGKRPGRVRGRAMCASGSGPGRPGQAGPGRVGGAGSGRGSEREQGRAVSYPRVGWVGTNKARGRINFCLIFGICTSKQCQDPLGNDLQQIWHEIRDHGKHLQK